MLSDRQLERFQDAGHLTVQNVFDRQTMAAALADVDAWSRQFLEQLTADQRRWYLEQADATGTVLRKLDEPVFHRPVFRQMAQAEGLVAIVKQLIGSEFSIFYSQIFCKPPEVGGPKPLHQDNFYFGPDNPDATLTVWVALDDATVENGCLFYWDGSHRGPLHQHVAPAGEPFNLQIPLKQLGHPRMTPAPVPAGGISIHHGNVCHQSSSNLSSRPRRAIAMHYLADASSLVKPALRYDPAVAVKISV